MGGQSREATDVFIYIVSGFGTKDASRDEPDSKPNIGETSSTSIETIDSAEDVFRGKIRVRRMDRSLLCEGERALAHQQMLRT